MDWSSQGELWIAESAPPPDLATGGGQIVSLEDSDQDGVYDQRRVFLAGLPTVTSVLDWPPGILVAAAPDLLYAEDRDGDGQADVVRRLFVGFGCSYSGRRFNSLRLGLDGWVYAANGLAGGRVQALDYLTEPGAATAAALVNLEETDFRFSPSTGRLEPVAGLSGAARTRDAFGNWFGLGSEADLVQFPLPRDYTDRNPAAVFPDPVVPVAGSAIGKRKTSPELNTTEGFLPEGGIEVFEAPPMGPVHPGDLLIAQANTGRIEHLRLDRDGPLFVVAGTDPAVRQVLAESTQAGFSPVQVRTGPDDRLWILDFGGLDGDPESLPGRILTLESTGSPPAPIQKRLALLNLHPLQALANPNSTLRDMAQRQVGSPGPKVPDLALEELAANGPQGSSVELSERLRAAVQVQALSVLAQTRVLSLQDLEQAMRSGLAAVRIHALRLSEPALVGGFMPEILPTLAKDSDPGVRYQLALTLGVSPHPRAPSLLAGLAVAGEDQPWLRAAFLASAAGQPLALLEEWLRQQGPRGLSAGSRTLTEGLVSTALAQQMPEAVARVLAGFDTETALAGAGGLVNRALPDENPQRTEDPAWITVLRPTIARARLETLNTRLAEEKLIVRLPLLAAELDHRPSDWTTLLHHANRGASAPVRDAALQSLLRSQHTRVAVLLLESWPALRPSLRPQILAACIERPSWTPLLLGALESHRVVASELSPANRDRLLLQANPGIQQQMVAVLRERLPEPRTKVLQEFRTALGQPGDPVRGREAFQDLCAICHAPPPPLRAIGPNLATIGARTPVELLRAILDPNAMIEPAHRTYFIETADDESLTGLLQGETDHTLELLQVGGITTALPLDQAIDIRASNLSLMPEGLEAGLPAPKLADLLAYLATLR